VSFSGDINDPNIMSSIFVISETQHFKKCGDARIPVKSWWIRKEGLNRNVSKDLV
jgi:hypothetical protein